jgi:hypothetical protein
MKKIELVDNKLNLVKELEEYADLKKKKLI